MLMALAGLIGAVFAGVVADAAITMASAKDDPDEADDDALDAESARGRRDGKPARLGRRARRRVRGPDVRIPKTRRSQMTFPMLQTHRSRSTAPKRMT